MATTSGQKFYQEHLACLAAHDIDGLVDHGYAPDGTLVTFDGVIQGRQELKVYFRAYLDRLGYIKVITTDKFTETADSIFFEATVETKLGVVQVYDVFVLKDGKATHHFAGFK